MKGRIKIREYQNCINIEVKAKKEPVKIAVVILLAVFWPAIFYIFKKYALILPWAVIETGLIFYTLWLFLEKTTISVFPQYIMVVHNYFFIDITGKFFQRDAVTGLRKADDGGRIIFEYLRRPETLIAGLSKEEAAFIMKFLVFSLSSSEFKKVKK